MINFLCLLCSLCIQFASVGITPFNYSGYYYDTSAMDYLSRLSGVDLLSIFHANYANDTAGIAYSVSPLNFFTSSADDMIVTFNSYILDDNQNVIGYSVTYQNVRVHYWSSSGQLVYSDYSGSNIYYVVCYFNDYVPVGNSSVMRVVLLNDDYLPYILNNVVFVYDDVLPDDDIIGHSIGVLDPTGHSQGDPLETLQGFSWTAHSSTYTQIGHNTHVNPSNATPDFTNPTQNLLGQIVDNTNSLISNTNNIGGALETINGNIINGACALFNAISQLNTNFVSSVIIDKEELNDQWTASNTYLAFVSMNNSFNLLQSTTEDLIDRYSATEDVDELIIPIDLTVWQIESSNFGDFKPFNQVYYMRFGFLDETKALWQPLFIALLYFCLFYGIVLDLPNIIRGVKS